MCCGRWKRRCVAARSGVVIGEICARGIDHVATRRLSLAAAAGETLGLLLRTTPEDEPCAFATRWIIGAAPSALLLLHERFMASGRRVWPCVSFAIAGVIAEHGSWSGTVWSSVSSSQRILSLWLGRLSTDRIIRQSRDASALGPPHCLRQARQSRPRCRGRCRGGAGGSSTGLALAQARAMYPALTAMPEDQAADARLLIALADWCQRYTPLIAADPRDGILLDISGCAHLFGSEEKLREDLLARVTGLRFLGAHRHRLDHRRGLGGGAFRRCGHHPMRQRTRASRAAAACGAEASPGDGCGAGPRRP